MISVLKRLFLAVVLCVFFLMTACANSHFNEDIYYYHVNDAKHKIITRDNKRTVFIIGESKVIKSVRLLNIKCECNGPNTKGYPINWIIIVNHLKTYKVTEKSIIILNDYVSLNTTINSIWLNAIIPSQQKGSPLYVNMQCYVIPD